MNLAEIMHHIVRRASESAISGLMLPEKNFREDSKARKTIPFPNRTCKRYVNST